MVRNHANEDFIHDLRPSSPLLLEMRRDFSVAFPFRDSIIVCVYETKTSASAQKDPSGKWEMDGPKVVLVDKDSATAGRYWENQPHNTISMNTNHSDLVKFGDGDEKYDRIQRHLRNIVDQSEAVVRSRFQRPVMTFVKFHDGDETSDSASLSTGQIEPYIYKANYSNDNGMSRDKPVSAVSLYAPAHWRKLLHWPHFWLSCLAVVIVVPLSFAISGRAIVSSTARYA
ncbi:hypothetical protein MMC13_002501 [Lambiella insularis]|nr:hypothetical protein [Lambiella insularis]